MLGLLIGWRKITVGDRDWRIVWRVTSDETGALTITISEVWAVGARSDAAVYEEMTARAASLGSTPATQALSSVIEMLGRHVQRPDIQATTEPANDPIPAWLEDRLIGTTGLRDEEVRAMTGAQAISRWERHMQSGT